MPHFCVILSDNKQRRRKTVKFQALSTTQHKTISLPSCQRLKKLVSGNEIRKFTDFLGRGEYSIVVLTNQSERSI